MIRLCDRKVYQINLNEITYDVLLDFFCKKEELSDILMVVDEGGKAAGFISYESLAYGTEDCLEGCIIKDTVSAGMDMWKNTRQIFQKFPNLKYLPVYDKDRELQYFCYEDMSGGWWYQEIWKQITYLLEHPQVFVWKEEFPDADVVEIYDMNEFSFFLYYVLEQRNMPVILQGEKWKLFDFHSEDGRQYLDYQKMKIYSEGTELFLPQKSGNDVSKQFSFFKDYFDRAVRLLEMKMRQEWDNFFTCRFPEWDQLSSISLEEEYRIQNDIDGSLSMKLPGIHQKMQYAKVAGMEREEFLIRKQQDDLEIASKRQEFYGDVRVVRSSEGANTVWLLGPCIVNGITVLYHDFLSCYIDRYLKKKGIQDYGICNVGYSTTDIRLFQSMIRQLPIRKKDIVVNISCDSRFGELLGEEPDLKLNDLFETRGEETWFYNIPIHTNARGNEKVAQEISEKIIIPFIQNVDEKDNSLVAQGEVLSEKGKLEVKKYLEQLQQEYGLYTFLQGSNRTGAIVMNCNPFTLGHRYLIEQSAKTVSKLIVFVVQEDKSFFTFQDRMRMVRAGTQDLGNVIVVPSGEFVLSHHTLPTYFQKEEYQEVKIDASLDVEIFARHIAPRLGVKVRFAGEEPIDKVTAQYNQQMDKILPEWGVEFVEIPRKQFQGEVISASEVRKALETGNWEKIKQIVPETTRKVLEEMSNE